MPDPAAFHPEPQLSRRERQIMDLVFANHPVTARAIHAQLPEAPSYSTVRKLLSVLIEKGELKAKPDGRALTYEPVRSPIAAAKSAIQRLVDTFFGGSLEAAVAGLLDHGEERLSAKEAADLRRRIAKSASSEANKEAGQ